MRRPLVAAGVALALLSGSVAAAVAVPPVREWMTERLAALGANGGRRPVAPEAGLAVEVDAAGVVVDLRDCSPELVVSLSYEDAHLLDIVGTGEAAAGEYRSGEGRVTVARAGGGELRVVIPRAAAGPVTLTSGADTLVRAGPAGLHMPDGSVVPSVRARLGELLPARSRRP